VVPSEGFTCCDVRRSDRLPCGSPGLRRRASIVGSYRFDPPRSPLPQSNSRVDHRVFQPGAEPSACEHAGASASHVLRRHYGVPPQRSASTFQSRPHAVSTRSMHGSRRTRTCVQTVERAPIGTRRCVWPDASARGRPDPHTRRLVTSLDAVGRVGPSTNIRARPEGPADPVRRRLATPNTVQKDGSPGHANHRSGSWLPCVGRIPWPPRRWQPTHRFIDRSRIGGRSATVEYAAPHRGDAATTHTVPHSLAPSTSHHPARAPTSPEDSPVTCARFEAARRPQPRSSTEALSRLHPEGCALRPPRMAHRSGPIGAESLARLRGPTVPPEGNSTGQTPKSPHSASSRPRHRGVESATNLTNAPPNPRARRARSIASRLAPKGASLRVTSPRARVTRHPSRSSSEHRPHRNAGARHASPHGPQRHRPEGRPGWIPYRRHASPPSG